MPIGVFSKTHLSLNNLLHPEDLISESAALYLSHTMRTAGISLVGIFLPIYIFGLAPSAPIFNSLPVINGLVWVLAYFALRSLGVTTTIFLFGKALFARIRLGRALFMSLLFNLGEIALWLFAKDNIYLMIPAGLLAGLKVTFYWIPYHSFFVKKFAEGKYGVDTGVRFLLEKLATGITPLIGGLLITNFGFSALFVLSMMVLIMSGLPILMIVREGMHREHDVPNIIRNYCFNRKFKLTNLAYFGEAIDATIYTVAWPILLFIGLQSFVKVGTLTSFSAIASGVTALMAGKAMDKYGSKLVHGAGVFINSLLYIPRAFVTTPIFLYAIDVLDRLNAPMYSLPTLALSYEKARRLKNSSDFLIYRELVIHSSIAVFAAGLVFVLMQLTVWRWLFLVAALGSSLVYFMDLDRN